MRRDRGVELVIRRYECVVEREILRDHLRGGGIVVRHVALGGVVGLHLLCERDEILEDRKHGIRLRVDVLIDARRLWIRACFFEILPQIGEKRQRDVGHALAATHILERGGDGIVERDDVAVVVVRCFEVGRERIDLVLGCVACEQCAHACGGVFALVTAEAARQQCGGGAQETADDEDGEGTTHGMKHENPPLI